MATTAIVLFTGDLRVHDHPALHAACERADEVVPLFVLDEAILDSRYASPNRVSQLVDALRELRASLRARGSELVVRRGRVAEVVRDVAAGVRAAELHLSDDVSAYARRRTAALSDVAADLGMQVHEHPGITLAEPAALTPSSGAAFRVFTPYWRRWRDAPHRAPVPPPQHVPTRSVHAVLDPDDIPDVAQLVAGERAPELPPAGETAARDRLAWWLDGPIEDYERGHDDLGVDGTSRLSAHLHLGTLSVAEVVARLDLRRRGHEPFLRQLCWRDFNHQLLADRPDLITTDLRGRNDEWRDDEDAYSAWAHGETGYPIVDAGMRQLRREGWMHNRARLLTASFLTKHLRIDWRRGAWHFMDHLVDGDVANNFAQWQWTAGTGTDPRPNRMFNPVVQGRRYDPTGAYVRRYVPELAEVADAHIHAPWEQTDTLLDPPGGGGGHYAPPIVDHATARERFLAERGRR